MLEAIIFVGIQGAGKSSFYKERFFNTHVRINLDMLKTRHRERLLLRACVEMLQPFVVDNTNVLVEERARYIAAARAAKFRLVCYFFDATVSGSIARNERREPPFRVPSKAIGGTYKRLQRPTLAEGFDALYLVRIAEGGGFLVMEPGEAA